MSNSMIIVDPNFEFQFINVKFSYEAHLTPQIRFNSKNYVGDGLQVLSIGSNNAQGLDGLAIMMVIFNGGQITYGLWLDSTWFMVHRVVDQKGGMHLSIM